jgi:hypothetical protein
MNIQNADILNATPGTPNGYLSKDNAWAAVPFGDQFIILHKGKQTYLAKNYQEAKAYIDKKIKMTKKKSHGTLENLL